MADHDRQLARGKQLPLNHTAPVPFYEEDLIPFAKNLSDALQASYFLDVAACIEGYSAPEAFICYVSVEWSVIPHHSPDLLTERGNASVFIDHRHQRGQHQDQQGK